MGSIAIGFLYFVSNESVWLQYVLGSCCILIYAVPIPISYLINESRVKDTIISSGWLKGFQSIFYSAEKIRQLRRESFLSSLASSQKSSSRGDFPQNEAQHGTLFHKRKRECDAVPSVTKPSSSLKLCANHVKRESTIPYYKKPMEKSHTEKYEYIVEDIEQAELRNVMVATSSVFESYDLSMSIKPKTPIAVHESTDQIKIKNQEARYDQLFKFRNNAEINDFKKFSRNYLLNDLLTILNANHVEIQYCKYLECLNDFEMCLERHIISNRSFDVLTSLMNAWCLRNMRGINLQNTKYEDDKQKIATFEITKSTSELQLQQRKQVLQLLFANISNEVNFVKYLKILNAIDT